MHVAARVAAPEMNRLESAYAHVLEAQRQAGLLQWWAYEPVSLRLAKGAAYCPDFVLLKADGTVEAHETKGHWREAARVRIKVAARAFPWIRFLAIQREGKQWIEEEIKP